MLRERASNEAREATFGPVIDRWINEELANRPWSRNYKVNQLAMMRKIQRELGTMQIHHAHSLFIKTYLAKFCKRGELFNKWLLVFSIVCAFALETRQGRVTVNEAANVVPRSESKKLEVNREARTGLDIDGFKAIHAHAPHWLQLAMEISLLTLMARSKVLALRHDHFRNGRLYVIRKKVAAESDMGFISVRLTPELEAFRHRALRIDNVTSPYLIHRQPGVRKQPENVQSTEEWARITGDYLTKAFQAAREATGLYESVAPKHRPTFHEIRGLGSRVYLASNIGEEVISPLMTHADQQVTKIYTTAAQEPCDRSTTRR